MTLLDQVAQATALVLETNNLRGGAAQAQAEASLRHAMASLAAQTLPLQALAQLVITHDGLGAACMAELRRLAGRAIDFVQIDPSLDYYAAKNAGFASTDPLRITHVVFADSDCTPAPCWLAELLTPFTQSEPPAAVAGRTSYAAGIVGTALTTIDFMYFPSPLETGATRNFYANNIAFRREVFEQHRYQAVEGVYRANCQVLGLALQAAGVAVRYAPAAHTEHRLPDTWRETLQLRWMRGEDTLGLTPYLVRAYLPAWLQWLARSGPVGPVCVQLGRLSYSLRALNRQDLPALRGGRWLMGLACIVGFSVVDLTGAVARGFGFKRAASSGDQTLSYHRR
ncbi:MAG: glycosyltransferase family 2 protein [Pseudomonadota bacterium]